MEWLVIQLRAKGLTSAEVSLGVDGHTDACVRLASGGRRPSTGQADHCSCAYVFILRWIKFSYGYCK